jgi:redox-sensitive bicupin YhaK (pirin superfamily)
MEGAGVRLRRAFGFGVTELFDPFLLLDDFRSDNPSDYLKGFPWHPHRGIETITYMHAGTVEHGDSLGNSGVIAAGDVQWMTAGNGIIHQEMPKGDGRGSMHGFQLWANLPAKSKMMPPRYREVKSADIPAITPGAGVTVRIISGNIEGTRGPVRDVVIEPEYIDVELAPGASFHHPVKRGNTAIAYVVGGDGHFGGAPEFYPNATLVLFGDGDEVVAEAGKKPMRFLLVSGTPLREPVAWHGPIVMNTQEELRTAFRELEEGTFIRA